MYKQSAATINNQLGNSRPATPQQHIYQQQQTNIYMQSGTGTTANTQTTKSGNAYATSSQQSPMTPAKQQKNPARKAAETKPTTSASAAVAPKAAINNKKSSNIDLLSDIDFLGAAAVPPPILPQPMLKPEVSSPPASQVAVPTTPQKIEQKDDKLKQVEVGFIKFV